LSDDLSADIGDLAGACDIAGASPGVFPDFGEFTMTYTEKSNGVASLAAISSTESAALAGANVGHQEILPIRVTEIIVTDDLRAVTPEATNRLRESMEVLGLHTPITIRYDKSGRPVLVAGRYRLEAAKSLSWETINCQVLNGTEATVRLWQISENLHRIEPPSWNGISISLSGSR
jgi:uncharacterized ParB-like nuclease family protein